MSRFKRILFGSAMILVIVALIVTYAPIFTHIYEVKESKTSTKVKSMVTSLITTSYKTEVSSKTEFICQDEIYDSKSDQDIDRIVFKHDKNHLHVYFYLKEGEFDTTQNIYMIFFDFGIKNSADLVTPYDYAVTLDQKSYRSKIRCDLTDISDWLWAEAGSVLARSESSGYTPQKLEYEVQDRLWNFKVPLTQFNIFQKFNVWGGIGKIQLYGGGLEVDFRDEIYDYVNFQKTTITNQIPQTYISTQLKTYTTTSIEIQTFTEKTTLPIYEWIKPLLFIVAAIVYLIPFILMVKTSKKTAKI